MVGGMKHKAEFGGRALEGGVFSSRLPRPRVAAGPSSVALLICALGIAPGVTAQVLVDPTRPPAGILSGAPNEPGGATNPLLQSVKISGGDKSAIIGGETVRLGGKFGDARVVKITETEVVLRSASGTETLRMYPEVNIKSVEPPPAVPGKATKRLRRPAAITQGKQG